MNIITDIASHIEALRLLDIEKLEEYKQIIKEAVKTGKTIYVAGNGGSASDSAHLVGEIVGKFLIDRCGYPSVDLTANTTVITAIGNDYSFEEIFSRQLEASAKPGDVLVTFSTSGNSKNIIKVIESASNMDVTNICLVGHKGGHIGRAGFKPLVVKSNSTPIIQVIHTFILHQLAYAVDEAHNEIEAK